MNSTKDILAEKLRGVLEKRDILENERLLLTFYRLSLFTLRTILPILFDFLVRAACQRLVQLFHRSFL